MFRNINIFLAFTVSSYISAFAQTPENPGPPIDTASVVKEFLINPLTKQADSVAFDTTMQEFHVYNPVYKSSFSNSFLGNSGQASQSNDFSLRNAYSPFVFEKPYLAYFHSPFNISHFNTRKPFTQIEYVFFGKSETSEQVLKALHTQNLSPDANFGFLYDLIASRGIYLDQNTKTNRFSFFGSYNKNAYSIYGSVNINKVTQTENGGLIDIAEFEKHVAKEPKNYKMLLDTAESVVRKNVFFITQTLDILKGTKDTSSAEIKKEKSLFHLNHTFSYSKHYRLYTDFQTPDSLNFYTNYYYGINMANDSAATHILENSFQISGDSYKFLPGFIAGVKHQYQEFGSKYPYTPQISIKIPVQSQIHTLNLLTDTVIASHKSVSYNNLSIFASLLDRSKKRIEYEAFMEYFYTGFRQNDLTLDFHWRYFTKNKYYSLTTSANFYLTEPDFFVKNYSSSHFLWSHDFRKVSNTGAKISIAQGKGLFTADAGFNIFGNYIYFDTTALPQVSDKAFLVSYLRIYKKFKWRGFNQINRILVQKNTSDEAVQLPLLAFGNISYYENAFFDQALKIQLGFDLYYNTSYFADAYMPATGMFYRQDKKQVGNYPFMDAFLNWKIKRTRLFLKYTNVFAGLAGYNYFTTYGYPINEGGLRFGFSWTFYD